MKPTNQDIAYWKAYTELVDQYEQKHGDEYHVLAQNWAIKELAKLLRVSEKEVNDKVNKVCDWLMAGFKKG